MYSPSDISGLSHVLGASLIVGGTQLIYNDNYDWIGTCLFVGPGAGFSGTEEFTVFHSFLGRDYNE